MKTKLSILFVIVILTLSACSAGSPDSAQIPSIPTTQPDTAVTAVATEQSMPTEAIHGQGQLPDAPIPPQEAFDACVGKAEKDTCEFPAARGPETGLCETVQNQLACSPQRGQVEGQAGEQSGSNGSQEIPVGVIQPISSDGVFTLVSSEVEEGGSLPVEYTCDGASATPPLSWSGAPEGTTSFAVLMDHIAGPDDYHWYWILYDIPTRVNSLEKNSTGIGVLGSNSVNGKVSYSPPCSKGPGPKIYTYTVYALSNEPTFLVSASGVNREVFLAAIKNITLASASLNVTYSRQ